MKLITPFTILNQNFHEMDLTIDAMKNRRLATEKFIKIINLPIENRRPIHIAYFSIC